uniref:Secreted protein n=1 Tax=Haemonchus contortus TaxID=6289 RepID=A0A7I4Z6I0_HAECO
MWAGLRQADECFILLETWPTHPTLDPVSPGGSKGAKEFRDRHTDIQTDRQTDRRTHRLSALYRDIVSKQRNTRMSSLEHHFDIYVNLH